jgi:hypothetical protein
VNHQVPSVASGFFSKLLVATVNVALFGVPVHR